MQETIVAAARSWIGTRYVHQQARKGAGCDCLGLVRGVWRDVHGAEPEEVPPYTPDWSETTGEERLWLAARRWMQERGSGVALPGDVLLFRMRSGSVAKHLGIMTGPASFVHAYSGHGVVESALTLAWRRRVVAVFGMGRAD